MRRAVVHDPEHASCVDVWRLAHDLIDQTLEGRYARGRFAAAEHLGAMHVQRCHIRPRRRVRTRAPRALTCPARWIGSDACEAELDAGLLAGGDGELVQAQRPSLPAPLVQVQDAAGLGLEVRVAWKDPATVPPRANRVLVQPTPDRAVADARHQARALRVSRHVGNAQARQRHVPGGRQLAGERLDLNRELWGERPEGVPGGLSLRDPPIDP